MFPHDWWRHLWYNFDYNPKAPSNNYHSNAIQLQNIINFNDASEQSPRSTFDTYSNTKSAAVVPLESMLQLIKNIFVIKMIPMNKYVFNWAILQTAMKHLKQILEIQSN